MKRKEFIKKSALLGSGLVIQSKLNALKNLSSYEDSMMPVLFMGHGNPMNAISDNEVTRNWAKAVKDIPKPKAILCISAHWETKGSKVCAVPNPKTIYDMYGFPKALYEVEYKCPGSPEMAEQIMKRLPDQVFPDLDWGLDHGAWSLLVKMYPDASIPCFQLSLNTTRDMRWHFDFAKQLNFLRKQGVLIVGSGNIVHNLRYARFDMKEPYEWAKEFDVYTKERMDDGDFQSLVDYQKFGNAALLSVNSAEHYIPMLYTLALKNPQEEINHFNEVFDFGSGSMRCFRIG